MDMIGPTAATQQCEKVMEEDVTVEEDPNSLDTTYLFDTRHCRFKVKEPTEKLFN